MIPAFLLMGHGVAKIIKIEKNVVDYVDDPDTDNVKKISAKEKASLSPKRTEYAAETVSSEYETGEAVPASVVENTTSHLELDSEAKTNVLTENQDI
ncbi:MAG: hypothetical protein OEM82_03605 [Acidobacteriota bacterium]|nr:hypothetical protein [Acidobacteriota bacterium]MDH3529657.1 hypothetical protein [Acidobacteriota bacterium]